MFRAANAPTHAVRQKPRYATACNQRIFILPSRFLVAIQWAVPITCVLSSFVYLPIETFYFISSKQHFHLRPISILHLIVFSPTHLCILKISI